MCLSEQTPGTPGSVFLQLLALTCGNLWVIPRLDGVHARRGMVPGIGAASAQHMERGLVPSLLGGSWSSLLPGPAGGWEEVVSVNEETWGERKGQDPLPEKITMLRGVSSPLLCPGPCLDTAFPFMVLSILALCSNLTPFLSCFIPCSSPIISLEQPSRQQWSVYEFGEVNNQKDKSCSISPLMQCWRGNLSLSPTLTSFLPRLFWSDISKLNHKSLMHKTLL